jgi:hypothetical protein
MRMTRTVKPASTATMGTILKDERMRVPPIDEYRAQTLDALLAPLPDPSALSTDCDFNPIDLESRYLTAAPSGTMILKLSLLEIVRISKTYSMKTL